MGINDLREMFVFGAEYAMLVMASVVGALLVVAAVAAPVAAVVVAVFRARKKRSR